ncbi:hypothetical protein LCGC14_2857470 [marine sediment metagenome]|uniref:Uncharacterized protein n=1 Tax=marine sediment metagenome TaxID=412755 RepID=A0A0F8Y6J3_9ZZZZ
MKSLAVHHRAFIQQVRPEKTLTYFADVTFHSIGADMNRIKLKLKPVLIGSAQLANGKSFEIRKIHPDKPGCSVTDKNGDITYAGSESKAWSSVRYMGKIIHKTERSVA